MSQDPEDKLVIERRSADMKAAYELLAQFGAQLHGFDPGVTAFLGERPQMIVSGQGRGAWGENLSFTREEWKWLRPLLEELRDYRKTNGKRAATITPRSIVGEIIKEELASRGWSNADLAKRMNVTLKLVARIISGKQVVTSELARRLGWAFRTSVEFWSNLAKYGRSNPCNPS